ncbi:MAG: peptide chain release factor N(5)-glutamine methyltransferase [Sphingosinicella sp.]|nr:peptide chain release factor N(5)-glutamine methyltransferase [Sphingosinicella sp.]
MTSREALALAAARLKATSDTPRLDAECLMAEALDVEREALLLSDLDRPPPETFNGLVDRRSAGEPIAYIIGRRAFWRIELEVGPGALVPRPDSETLIEAALDHFGQDGPSRVLDLGTGPGTLLLAALDQWPRARGVGVDISEEALAYANRNAERLGLSGRASFRVADWAAGLDERFDLILCNPPYVEAGCALPVDVMEWEPHQALFAGADGLSAYRRLAPEIARLLVPAGLACVEIGAGQEADVGLLFSDMALKVGERRDLGGHIRCLTIGR